MERIRIDADLPEKIRNLTRAIELVNDDGFVAAVVQPRYDPEMYDLGADISPEEIERRCEMGRKTYSTEEVWA